MESRTGGFGDRKDTKALRIQVLGFSGKGVGYAKRRENF